MNEVGMSFSFNKNKSSLRWSATFQTHVEMLEELFYLYYNMHNQKDKEILDYLTNEKGEYIPQRCMERSLKKHGIYDYLINRYKDNTTDSFREISYRFINDIEEVPRCPMCGNPIPFSVSHNMYPQFCSKTCCSNDPEHKANNAAKVSAKRKEEYADPVRRAEIEAKKKATYKEKTGCDNNGYAFSIQSIRDKSAETLKEHYGVSNPAQIKK